jgi:hypothetical protein
VPATAMTFDGAVGAGAAELPPPQAGPTSAIETARTGIERFITRGVYARARDDDPWMIVGR